MWRMEWKVKEEITILIIIFKIGVSRSDCITVNLPAMLKIYLLVQYSDEDMSGPTQTTLFYKWMINALISIPQQFNMKWFDTI